MEKSKAEQLVTENELQGWCGYTRKADLLTFLRSNGIAYFRGKGGCVITTMDAINKPLSNETASKQSW